ncbi:SAM-dependent methyltransferase [Embleya scabrispora]|uniref:SAM-dependent methyltransferase n=1 Tax=Embleya scabrispora TaxID=159449 RepID=UPI0003A28A7F|nr:SAM-dependent methyltransferase [Embleya scabrispora]
MPSNDEADDWPETPGVDVGVPSVARVYDAVLGGKDHFAVDRAIADKAMAAMPNARVGAGLNRAILERGVRYMAECGIDQFLDLGSGLPTVRNTHEVAQEHNPEARVVYVDNDPIVLAHGRALLAENDRTRVVTADVRDARGVLSRPEVVELLDLKRPVGLLLVAVLHHLADEDDPAGLVRAYRTALAPGSFVFITHFSDATPEGRELERLFLSTLGSGRFRSRETVESFFEGTELVDPGVVFLPRWRPDAPVTDDSAYAGLTMIGGLGRVPDA